ncbi:MAG: protein kinase [Candidatus Obscuribacterales bacterium]|jgi:serine/threonine protein kinase/Tfp pilus assembly protein PilF
MSIKDDNNNFDGKNKSNKPIPQVKLAEAPEREKIELRSEANSDEGPTTELLAKIVETEAESAAVLAGRDQKTSSELAERANSGADTTAETKAELEVESKAESRTELKSQSKTNEAEPLPPMPKMMFGVLTATISILAFLIIPSEISSTHGVSNPLTSASVIVSAIFFVLHLVWFFISQKQLVKHTVPLLPESAKAAESRTALLTLLPIAWVSIVVYFFSQILYLSAFPILPILPWLMVISLIYFIAAMGYWPSKLKKLCSEQQKKSFPNPLTGVLLSCFMTVPCIWYWRKALVAVNKPDIQVPFKLQSKVIDRDKMVIRYRPFIAIERWFKHRHKTTSKKERYINAAIAITINAVLLQLFCYFFPTMAADIGKILDPNNFQLNQNNHNVIGSFFTITNHMFLILMGAMTATIAAMGAIFVFKQPTNYEFTPLGFRSFRWLGEKKIESELVPWNSLTSIELNTKTQRGQISASELQFNLSSGNPVKLSMGAVESVEDREIILDAIERWAPGVSRSAALVQALQPPVDHSYTEMWLQALSAPPQRDRLKPLTEDIVLNDGRYRVKRALGVGGQGAAYAAYDQASGDTVVLKEFLLPIYVDISIRKDVLESFESEARILKHLNHDQVVKLQDFFVEDHRAYLVLEHIDGKSLREIVAKAGPLSEERVRELSRQMCAILSYLHSQEPKVVHRDFTPENLILRNDGILKLIDFNVARQVESNATGSVVGKPAYLPPEQFRGQPVSQSDIYGMGATLSYLLTGKEPEPISVSHPRELNKGVSRSLDQIVAKATAINLKDRYANCEQILKDLDAAADASGNDDDQNDSHDNDDKSSGSGSINATDSHSKAPDAKQELKQNPAPEQRQEPPQATFSAAAPFKLKETPTDNVTLKIVESAHLVSNGQLALADGDDHEQVSTNQHPLTYSSQQSSNRNNSQSAQGSTNQLSTQINKTSKTISIASIVATIGAFVSWLTITIAIAWLLIPGSPAWFDSKAALHTHGHDAVVAYYKNDMTKALAECNKCIAIDPNCALAYFGRAYCTTTSSKSGEVVGQEAYERALPDLAKAVELAPDDYAVQAAYGSALSQTGRYAQAEAAFEKAQLIEHSAIVPAFVETIFHAKDVSLRSGKYEIAKAQLYQMRYQDALKFYDTLKDNRYYSYGCQVTDQITAYELAHQPAVALARSQDPMKYYDEKQKVGQSLFPIMMHRGALERALAATKKDSTSLPAMNLFYDGLGLHGMGRYDQAVQKLSEAIKLKPDYVDFYLFRGSCNRYLHKYDLALADFQTALKMQPKNEYALYMQQQVLDNLSGKSTPKKMNWRKPE